MAVKILSEMKLGDGSTGYEFEVYRDFERDERVYREGLLIEKALEGHSTKHE